MRMEEFKDTPVVSIAEGVKLGSVHDLLLDDSYLQIAAVVIGGGGLLGGHRRAVAYGAIRGIGPDAVMVSGRDAVHDVDDASPFGVTHRLGGLHQEVMSESGVHLGRVSDVEFEPQTGVITALRFIPAGTTAFDGAAASVIARAEIVTLTAKMAVVRQTVQAQSAGDTSARPAAARGQVVGQEPAETPVRAGSEPAADLGDETSRPAAAPGAAGSLAQPANGRTGQERHAEAPDRAARN